MLLEVAEKRNNNNNNNHKIGSVCVCVCGYDTRFKPGFLLAIRSFAKLKMRYVFRKFGLTLGACGVK